MKTRKVAQWATLFGMAAILGNPVKADSYTTQESFEVASLIISLSKSITNDLNPPATGAERTVTKATVSEEGNSRVYLIEGKDVYHTGRVLSTYWLRLIKPLSTEGAAILNVGNNTKNLPAPMPALGRTLSDEAQRLIGPLLNSLYEIADLRIDHRRVHLEEINETSADPLTFEIIGLNDICEHEELNRFKLTLIRHFERNRPSYETILEHPYTGELEPPTVVLPPSLPLPVPVETIPVN